MNRTLEEAEQLLQKWLREYGHVPESPSKQPDTVDVQVALDRSKAYTRKLHAEVQHMKTQQTELQTAALIANEAHIGQLRYDGKTPYIIHPQAVAALLQDNDDKIVAWLHDVLEDNPKWTETRLWARGISESNVHDVVTLTHHHKGEEYYDYIMRLLISSKRARRVKIADLTHNLSCTPTKNGRQKYLLARHILQSVTSHEN